MLFFKYKDSQSWAQQMRDNLQLQLPEQSWEIRCYRLRILTACPFFFFCFGPDSGFLAVGDIFCSVWVYFEVSEVGHLVWLADYFVHPFFDHPKRACFCSNWNPDVVARMEPDACAERHSWIWLCDFLNGLRGCAIEGLGELFGDGVKWYFVNVHMHHHHCSSDCKMDIISLCAGNSSCW